ncbi:MAG: hypothetical protein V7603_2181 [Micromonosporaceae bacterium]
MILAADAVNRVLGSGLFWAGMGVGALTGAAFARMRLGWIAHRKVKDSMPGLRKTAWAGVGGFAKFAVILIALLIVTLAWLSGHHVNLSPASTPETPASPSSSTR